MYLLDTNALIILLYTIYGDPGAYSYAKAAASGRENVNTPKEWPCVTGHPLK